MASDKHDIIIIGAGIIGAAIAFEASKKGHKTLSVDKLAAAGYGSTSNTCAIIRTHYSTWEGTAIAWESFFHWKNWREYLEFEDERGLAKLYDGGLLIIRTKGQDLSRHLKIHDDLSIPYEIWDLETLKKKAPLLDDHSYGRRGAPTIRSSTSGPKTRSWAGCSSRRAATSRMPNSPSTTSSGPPRQRGPVPVQRGGDRDPPDRGTGHGNHAQGWGADRRSRGRQRLGTAFVRHQPDGGRRGGHAGQDQGAPPRGALRPRAK